MPLMTNGQQLRLYENPKIRKNSFKKWSSRRISTFLVRWLCHQYSPSNAFISKEKKRIKDLVVKTWF
jgi:hypothetical protein